MLCSRDLVEIVSTNTVLLKCWEVGEEGVGATDSGLGRELFLVVYLLAKFADLPVYNKNGLIFFCSLLCLLLKLIEDTGLASEGPVSSDLKLT